MLKLGDTGGDVRALQILLQGDGANVRVDGWYGPATAAAVREAQRKHGLVVDGIAGPKTIATLRVHQRDPRLLGHQDIGFCAQYLGVQVAAIRAVVQVESRGAGFLADGRPVILYERHIMYRRLRELGIDAEAASARHPDIVQPTRGGYVGGAAEHARLDAARRIHPAAAIESCSWGLFQIMGIHWQALGYGSAALFESLNSTTEGYQLQAFALFVRANPPIHAALRDRAWGTFARLYNGPGYRTNLYDTRLARAYARYAAEEHPPLQEA